MFFKPDPKAVEAAVAWQQEVERQKQAEIAKKQAEDQRLPDIVQWLQETVALFGPESTDEAAMGISAVLKSKKACLILLGPELLLPSEKPTFLVYEWHATGQGLFQASPFNFTVEGRETKKWFLIEVQPTDMHNINAVIQRLRPEVIVTEAKALCERYYLEAEAKMGSYNFGAEQFKDRLVWK